jgi:hypothetical protein
VNGEQFLAQAAIAVQAIATHAVDRGLPVPSDISTHTDEQVVRVRFLLPSHRDAWLMSVCIDGESNVEHRLGVVTTWVVRLPDTGVRFEMRGFRAVPFAGRSMPVGSVAS